MIADRRGGVIVDAEHVDRAADADHAGRDAEADHYDVFLAARLDHDVVERVDRRMTADVGVGGVADDIDAHGRRHPDRARRERAGQRQVIEIVAGADQDRLAAVRRGGIAVDNRVVADIGLGGRVDHVDPRRDRDADHTGREA